MTDENLYRIEGSYYEACNCEAICPCRRQNGVPGGAATHDTCDFMLSWMIKKGHSSDIDLSGRSVCMAGSYNEHEDGQPWSVLIYIDAEASDAQFDALSRIFQGRDAGNILFTSNISNVLAIKRAVIDLEHVAGKETIRIADLAKVRVDRSVTHDGTISCGIPGHDHPGTESVSSIAFEDGPFAWDYKERCGFATVFAHWN
jgi:hypothetical protein